ncbi:hypothetical protein TcYC6_0003850 [Trypanosoma cruzi]|nr:hypothetical protein TcYC6_0003850 [Trypanosoma cruzi]
MILSPIEVGRAREVSVNTQKADAATAEEERRRENTDATRKTFMEVSGQHRRPPPEQMLRQLLATVTAAPQHRGLPVHSFTLLLVCAAAAPRWWLRLHEVAVC